MSNSSIIAIVNASSLGGAELSTIELLEGLTEYDLVIISPYLPETGSKEQWIYVELKRFQYTKNPIRILMYIYQVLKYSLIILKIAKKRQCDLIYIHSIQSFLYGIIPGWFFKKKIVFHARDNPTGSLLYKLVYFVADEIICVSRSVYKLMPDSVNKRVLLNGVNTRKYPKQPDIKTGRELCLNQGVKIVAQIAHLIPWKNHLLFLEIAARVLKEYQNVHFVIIGDDLFEENQGYIREIRKKIDSLEIRDKVSLLGKRSHDEVIHWLHLIDILVHPSKSEPFGRVIVEAMLFKIPVIAMNSGGPMEVVIDGKSGYLINESEFIKKAVSKLTNLLNNDELTFSMGEYGRRLALDKFDLSGRQSEFEKLIDGIFQ